MLLIVRIRCDSLNIIKNPPNNILSQKGICWTTFVVSRRVSTERALAVPTYPSRLRPSTTFRSVLSFFVGWLGEGKSEFEHSTFRFQLHWFHACCPWFRKVNPLSSVFRDFREYRGLGKKNKSQKKRSTSTRFGSSQNNQKKLPLALPRRRFISLWPISRTPPTALVGSIFRVAFHFGNEMEQTKCNWNETVFIWINILSVEQFDCQEKMKAFEVCSLIIAQWL